MPNAAPQSASETQPRIGTPDHLNSDTAVAVNPFKVVKPNSGEFYARSARVKWATGLGRNSLMLSTESYRDKRHVTTHQGDALYQAMVAADPYLADYPDFKDRALYPIWKICLDHQQKVVSFEPVPMSHDEQIAADVQRVFDELHALGRKYSVAWGTVDNLCRDCQREYTDDWPVTAARLIEEYGASAQSRKVLESIMFHKNQYDYCWQYDTDVYPFDSRDVEGNLISGDKSEVAVSDKVIERRARWTCEHMSGMAQIMSCLNHFKRDVLAVFPNTDIYEYIIAVLGSDIEASIDKRGIEKTVDLLQANLDKFGIETKQESDVTKPKPAAEPEAPVHPTTSEIDAAKVRIRDMGITTAGDFKAATGFENIPAALEAGKTLKDIENAAWNWHKPENATEKPASAPEQPKGEIPAKVNEPQAGDIPAVETKPTETVLTGEIVPEVKKPALVMVPNTGMTALGMMEQWQIMRQQADVLIKSGFLPQSIKTPEQALAIMMMGSALQIDAIVALNTINVIQGKPTVSPQLMLALVRRSGQLEHFRTFDEGDCAVVEIKRRGETMHVERFSVQDANAMGLSGKDNWRKQPATMRKWRAVAAACRVVFPDVTWGIASYTTEEIDPDYTIEAA